MKTRLSLLLAVILLTVWMNGASVSAQTTQGATASDPLQELPASDVVAFADMRSIFATIQRLLVKDPETFSRMMGQVVELYQKTGINIVGIDRVAVGVQFIGANMRNMNKENLGVVFIVHGVFDSKRFIAFIEKDAKGKGRHETYGGKLIHIEPAPKPSEKKSERETGALAFLDDQTLIIGDLPQVRATIDAASGKGRVDPALIQLASQDANALIGMAGNVPASLTEDLSKSATPGDEAEQAISRIVVNIKQVFSSITENPAAFNVVLGARLNTAEQAQSLVDLLFGIRQQTVPYIQDQTARDILSKIQITAQGDQVRLSDSINKEMVQNFVIKAIKENQSAEKTDKKPQTQKRTTTRGRQTKRRRTH